MPSSKPRVRSNSPLDRLPSNKAVGKRVPVLSEQSRPTKTRIEHSCAHFVEEMDKELKALEDEMQQAKERENELLSRRDSLLGSLDTKLMEKEALLKECQEMRPDLFVCGFEEKVIPAAKDERYILPFHVEDAKKPSTLYEKVIKEFIKMRNLNYEYALAFVEELSKNKRLEEIVQIMHGAREHKGRTYFINKIKELESEIKRTDLLAEEITKKTTENIGNCWEKAANIYGPKMRELLDKKGSLENEFLDKEAKLKELETKETQLDKEITTRKSKLERQTEINRKQIFNSIEFKELMEHRDSLMKRIEKSTSVIEDTKEACKVAILKKNDLYLNLLKNQKRVEELATKDFELSCEIENERNNTMASSSLMDFVSQELNAKNGILLQLEVTVEELQNRKDMLEENLRFCESQIENQNKKNAETETRINDLKREYFIAEATEID